MTLTQSGTQPWIPLQGYVHLIKPWISLLHRNDLCNVWRCQHGSERDFNYFTLTGLIFPNWPLIKLNAFDKCQRTRQIDKLLAYIKKKEDRNKWPPSPSLASALLEDRQRLRSLLLCKYETNLKFTKSNYYTLGNKAGALLARQVTQRVKAKIASLLHPNSKACLTNPQDITNAFITLLCSTWPPTPPCPNLLNQL